jgi:ABC-type amino acid transport substrate-binding protein
VVENREALYAGVCFCHGHSVRSMVFGLDVSPPPPMQIGDPSSDSFQGYEVDLMHHIADALHAPLVYRVAVWSALLDELKGGEIDAVCTAATVTAERAAEFDFGRPYQETQLVVVARPGSGIAGVEDLDGRTLMLRAATVAAHWVEEHARPASVRLTEFNDEMYLAVADGSVDAAVDDSPIARWFAKEHGLQIAGPVPDSRAQFALMFRKGNPLRQTIDAILAEAEANGRGGAMRMKWFGSDALLT